jgi:formate hydrogenlyase subunit 6/NADH:ubiquinone oxidoreductase subunit I
MQKGANDSYFQSISNGIKSSIKGLKLSFRHFKNARKKMPLVNVNDESYFSKNSGTVTLQYPNEVISVPDNGRYRLFNEMDDCIVCDKCAKVCPVDCIDIEPIKSAELIGNASDGSPIRLYAAKFDIDMAKCCFCGLCTTVCPTVCLTMTKAYDFSEFDVKDFNYHYANLSPEQADEKKRNYEQFILEKEAAKALAKPIIAEPKLEEVVAKPSFRPSFRKVEPASESNSLESSINDDGKPKPVFRPVVPKPKADDSSSEMPAATAAEAKPRPVFRPAVPKPKVEDSLSEKPVESAAVSKPGPVFRPAVPKPKVEDSSSEKSVESVPEAKPRPVFRPAVPKPKVEDSSSDKQAASAQEAKPRPVFRPVVPKPKID